MKTLPSVGCIILLAGCARMSTEAPDVAGAETERSTALISAQSAPACSNQRAQLERAMSSTLDRSATDPSITSSPDFTLALQAADGHRFVHAHGTSSLDTRYESASTSKWVTTAVILDLVDQGVLSLDSQPTAWLPYWHVPGVTLARLLSFTSGFSLEPSCINLAHADFADCVRQAYDLNAQNNPVAGARFEYSSTHLQIAGLMAIRAAGATSWAELFAHWQTQHQLFPTGAYDLPSLDNPRLAGGMHWTGSEYLDFLRAIHDGSLLGGTLGAMLDNQRGSATVDAAGSPVLDRLGQDWAYGFGNWLECPGALGPNTFDCGPGHRNSSPGAYGAYPFVDFDQDYFGIVARQGGVGTFPEGIALFAGIADQAAQWAGACPGN